LKYLTIEISKYKTKPFLVTTWSWYRLPNTPIEKFQEFEKLLQYIDLEDKESIILGDLNCDLRGGPRDYRHKQKFLKKYSYKLKKPPPPPSLF
jgi:hypothetical protein